MSTDLTLVVTAHNETSVCGPTMRSADLAVAAARAAGVTVQTIIGLDGATDATTSYFRQSRFDHWDRWEYDEGDLGRVRNAMVPRTEGRLIAFLDADDLFSENWLVEAVRVLDAAAERGERAIAHPEMNMVFDGKRSVWVNLPDDSPLFTPHYLYVRHPYDSLCMAPREAHLELPYVSRDVPNGLSYQDFQFTIETLDAGWRHLVVPDTVIFKRRRDFSLVTESTVRKSIVRAIPAMAIDRVRSLGARAR
ncbi:MAG: glycosyltransferase family 2 protein [Nocardioides sp.]|nr:glycosyltransferase family 2 protein [Nocardioides sp.]